MADSFRKPEPLSFEGNVAENWRWFELELDIFMAAAHHDKQQKTKAYTMLNIAETSNRKGKIIRICTGHTQRSERNSDSCRNEREAQIMRGTNLTCEIKRTVS